MAIRVRSDAPSATHGTIVATLLAAVEALTGVSCDGYAEAILAGESTVGLTSIHCIHCDAHHTPRYLCDPARAILDALAAQAASRSMPTLEFLDQPLESNPFRFGAGPGDALLLQLVIQAATVPIGETGMLRPAVVFTGQDHNGRPLPQWLYAATPQQLDEATTLFRDMAALAVKAARRGGQKGTQR